MSELASFAHDDEGSPQDQRRAQILSAARTCFARAGFHGASMQQVCAEARMSPGALYRYFPSKESIIEAIAEEERMKASAVMAVFHTEGTLVDRIMATAEAHYQLMKTPGRGALMFEVCSESMRSSNVGERFRCIETDIRGELFEAIAAAQARGEVDPTVDAAAAVTILLAIGDGLAMRVTLEEIPDFATIAPALRRVLVGLLPAPVTAPA